MVSNQPEKTKTKAKQRYLRVKRERKKKRKAAAAEALHKTDVKSRILGDLSLGKAQRDSHWSRHGSQTSQASDLEESARSSVSPPTLDYSSDRVDQSALMHEDLSGLHHQSSELAPLAAFPMPSAPTVTPQETLALQGLDSGLVDAELIDSARTLPINVSDDAMVGPSTLGLSLRTRKRLKEQGITELFAVQTALLPFLLPPLQRSLYMPYTPPRDVCVSAPTGSGKTLAYVIPIIELLSTRVITRLRALIVLPTRDLVTQVRETFEALCKGRGLKVGTVTGQHSFTHEQTQLVEELSVPLQGGSSKIDILICTPGRLIDHLKGTMNFNLQHLRFLVIDEADRLLTQSFQDWLAQVLAATQPPTASKHMPANPLVDRKTSDLSLVNTLPRHDALSPAWLPHPPTRSHVDEIRQASCQKLLFSATLTRDPAKITALDLRDAKYFVVTDNMQDHAAGNHLVAGGTFVFPSTLNEYMIICSSYQKPLILFYLIHARGVTNALVFTKSAESTAKLVNLFECFENVKGRGCDSPIVHAYSSDLSAAERKLILERFKSQEITILVCSDLISRGIDISHVAHVVSYDAPVDMRKYVHRVGRTARAGRTGDAWCLVEEREARYFKSMLGSANHLAHVHKLKIFEEDLKDFNKYYESAMKLYSSKQNQER